MHQLEPEHAEPVVSQVPDQREPVSICRPTIVNSVCLTFFFTPLFSDVNNGSNCVRTTKSSKSSRTTVPARCPRSPRKTSKSPTMQPGVRAEPQILIYLAQYLSRVSKRTIKSMVESLQNSIFSTKQSR
ncbi:hypothetical protein ACI65C_007465 [Semiaphis heraclei]